LLWIIRGSIIEDVSYSNIGLYLIFTHFHILINACGERFDGQHITDSETEKMTLILNTYMEKLHSLSFIRN